MSTWRQRPVERKLEILWSNLELYHKRLMRPEWQDDVNMASLRKDIEETKAELHFNILEIRRIQYEEEHEESCY